MDSTTPGWNDLPRWRKTVIIIASLLGLVLAGLWVLIVVALADRERPADVVLSLLLADLLGIVGLMAYARRNFRREEAGAVRCPACGGDLVHDYCAPVGEDESAGRCLGCGNLYAVPRKP